MEMSVKMAVDKARETALMILLEVNEDGAYSNISIGEHFRKYEPDIKDKAFITELVNGTIKRKNTLDWIIGQYSDIKIKKISKYIINILRMGIYQIIYLDKIPKTAACDECVKLAKRYGHKASAGFVNAVLRKVSDNSESINYPLPENGIEKYLSVRYSHPEWLVNKWIEEFGTEFTESLMEANNKVPELSVRVNTIKTTKEELIKKLSELGIKTKNSEYADECLIISQALSIFNSEPFKDGLFSVQDESSALASKVMDPKKGELIIDVCSAPGGKTTHIAQLMNNKGILIARDKSKQKIESVAKLAKNLGIRIIKTEVFDAEKTDDSLIDKADRVLVDVPCTGFGIIRRKPEIKWKENNSDLKNIRLIQKTILNCAAKYVKVGGVIVYSTCTLGKEENQDVVSEFLADNEGFEPSEIAEFLPRKLKDKAKKHFIQLFPNTDKTDGFFIARMQRVR